MSFVPTSGQSILVDPPKDGAPQPAVKTGAALVSWLVAKAQPWERHRDDGYKARWGEYWRLWRGQWAQEDRNRASERSRLVAPALSQAIEMTTSEIEEGLFSKEVWFDIADDLADQDKLDALLARDTLLEDLANANAPAAVSEAVLNGAIFGTGIIKMNTEVVQEQILSRDNVTKGLIAKGEEKVQVTWESIRPDEFIPDPAGRTVGEMLGMFHKVKKPLHVVLEKIDAGLYRKEALATLTQSNWRSGTDTDIDPQDPQSMLAPDEGDEVEILEYHGKVPVGLLHGATSQTVSKDANGNIIIKSVTSIDDILAQDDEGAMVEAIVTIANQNTLLRAMVNPFTMRDRAIVAFQFEKVPGRFWGRGVGEKGFNPQKALDSEIRARIDALAYVSSPMIAVDGGRVPRGFKMEIRPGKVWITQGPPSDVLSPVQIGMVEPNTFNQASEMERMVQMGTGAFDTASNLKGGSDANGPQAASLIMGAFVKRAKRAIRNVNDNLMQPLLKKTMWRYMQYAPRRYPNDYEFRVMATLGIVAREVEAMQLTQLMGMMPEQFPQVTATVAKGIIDLGSLHNKAEILKAIDAATAPPPPEEIERKKQMEEMQFMAISAEAEGKVLDNRVKIATVKNLLADTQKKLSEAGSNSGELQVEVARLQVELEELEVAREKNKVELVKAHMAFKTAQANAEAAKAAPAAKK
jgi:hypothetical protein